MDAPLVFQSAEHDPDFVPLALDPAIMSDGDIEVGLGGDARRDAITAQSVASIIKRSGLGPLEASSEKILSNTPKLLQQTKRL